MTTGISQHRESALRADAARNRDRIVQAAREVFTARGIDAPLAAVARRAGVSPATLHRRFASRDDLVTAAFADQLGRCTTALAEAVDHPDPWTALCRLTYRICAMQSTDRGFSEAFFAAHPDFDDERLTHAETQLATLVARCQAAGRVRADVTAGDVMLLFAANAGVLQRNPAALDMSDRLVAHFLRGIATHADHPLRPAANLGVRRFLGRTTP